MSFKAAQSLSKRSKEVAVAERSGLGWRGGPSVNPQRTDTLLQIPAASVCADDFKIEKERPLIILRQVSPSPAY